MDPPRSPSGGHVKDMLSEADGSKVYRRNTLALASVLVLAGLAGADPGDLSVFGVKPGGDWGVIVISAAAIVTQLYWYILRCLHNKEDAEVEVFGTPITRFKISEVSGSIKRKSGDLFSNWTCFLLTALSWYFAISWIVDASFD